MEVMITQDAGDALVMITGPAEDFEGRGPAVHQISDEQETVGSGVERDLFEQSVKGLDTALNIADDIGRHGAAAPEFGVF